MCGRFAAAASPEEVASHFSADLEPGAPAEPRYNVAPGTNITAVRNREGERVVGALRWGLVPRWAKDPSIGNRMINARADKVATSGAYKRALRHRRCIIPADGFYEWAAVPGQRKRQPYYVSRPDGEMYALAGLWEIWSPGEGEEPLLTCTIITTEPNDALARIHDRMPVILPPQRWDAWLSTEAIDDIDALLVAAPEEITELRAVTTAVNDVRNEGPELLEPLP